MRRLAPFLFAGALAATLCLSLVAGSAGAQTPPPPDPRLFILGDSVILGARDALAAQLGAEGWQVTQVSEESLSTLGAASRIDGYAASIGEVVVVALGNNDGATPEQFAGWIDAVMDHLRSARRVYWLNMREFRSWVPAANAELVKATERWPSLKVLDWDAMSMPDPGLVAGDGLHLTPAGAQAMTALIKAGLDGYVAERTAPTTTTTIADVAKPTRVIRTVGSVATAELLAVIAGAGGLLLVGIGAVVFARLGRKPTPRATPPTRAVQP